VTRTVPEGWTLSTVGELAEYVNGLAFKPSDWGTAGRPIVRIQNLTDPTRRYNYTTREVPDRVVVRFGDILVSWSATLDAFVWRGPEAVLNQHIFRVLPSARVQDQRLLLWTLKQAIAELSRGEHAHGSTMQHVNRGPFLAHQVVIPPADQQEAIADEIEAHLSRVDATVLTLDRAGRNLRRYRESVLKSAVEGRLVSPDAESTGVDGGSYETASELMEQALANRRDHWRGVGKQGSYREPVPPEDVALPRLPAGWCWASLDQLLVTPLTNGRSVPTADAGFPVLRLTALQDSGVDLQQFKMGLWTAKEAAPFLVSEGDFMVARGNGSIRRVGRGSLVGPVVRPVAFPDTLIRVRVSPDVFLPRLLSLIWNSEIVRRHIERAAKTTAGIFKVNQADLAKIPLPVPPLAEQHRLLNHVERCLSIADVIQASVTRNLALVRSLGPSVLGTAFQGGLV
jgi:type I restriction enzyme S subunit